MQWRHIRAVFLNRWALCFVSPKPIGYGSRKLYFISRNYLQLRTVVQETSKSSNMFYDKRNLYEEKVDFYFNQKKISVFFRNWLSNERTSLRDSCNICYEKRVRAFCIFSRKICESESVKIMIIFSISDLARGHSN